MSVELQPERPNVLPPSQILDDYRYAYRWPKYCETDSDPEKAAKVLLKKNPSEFLKQLQAMERTHTMAEASVLKRRAEAESLAHRSRMKGTALLVPSESDEGTDRACQALEDWLTEKKRQREEVK